MGVARLPFAHAESLSQMSDSFPLNRGHRHFFLRISFGAPLSSMASASNRFSRVFSPSSVFRCFENNREGPLRVKGAVLAVSRVLPVYPNERTSSEPVAISQRCHFQDSQHASEVDVRVTRTGRDTTCY
jgi:hypothetical protein